MEIQMLQKSLPVGLGCVFALAGVAEAGNSLFPGGPRYDGYIKITEVLGSSCVYKDYISYYVLGKRFKAVFRSKTKPDSPAPETMSVELPLAGAIWLQAEGDGTLAGKNQSLIGTVIIDAYKYTPDGLISNLTFDPPAIGETTSAFTFKGTLKNYIYKDCTIKLQGDFDLRVPG